MVHKNLKVIDINVDEKPTGEISAGAGIGTSGGSFAFNISENNWLGQGNKVKFDLEVDEESLGGTVVYKPKLPLFRNSINYYISSVENDKPDQGYENSLISIGVNTSFEQYKDVFTKLGLSASYDDLRTLDGASSSLKKQSGTFSELAANYGFRYDKRNRAFMPISGSIISFDQSTPLAADRRYLANNFNTSITNQHRKCSRQVNLYFHNKRYW